MHVKIYYCDFCKRYTLKEVCPICGKKTKVKEPPPIKILNKKYYFK